MNQKLLCIIWVQYLNGKKEFAKGYFVNGVEEAHNIMNKMVHGPNVYYDLEILNSFADASKFKPLYFCWNKKSKTFIQLEKAE